MKTTLKRFARWVSIGGSFAHPKFGQTFALVAVARANGMQCITGYKGSMCFWHEIALAGTPAQMRKTDKQWEAAGHDVKTKKPGGAFGVSINRSPEVWVEHEMAKRLAHGCYGGACGQCDNRDPLMLPDKKGRK